MTLNRKFFTSEAVSEGHPDKLADRISDAVLDAYLAVDPQAKVACEVLITSGNVIIAGEITAKCIPAKPLIEIAREILRDTGYHHENIGFDCDNANYIDLTHSQSPEINASVEDGGAGDQGIMFGYACGETPQLMPLGITICHDLLNLLTEKRKSGEMPFLRPDAKAQVTLRYENGIPFAPHMVIISTQHDETIDHKRLNKVIEENIIVPVLEKYFVSGHTMNFVNPSGSFTIGGPHGDTGLTGRKIIVDSYGGSCPHGGGAFSGKDASKVDRSGAYMARYMAKHIVAAGLATKCTVQLSYGIRINRPLSVHIDLHDTSSCVESSLANFCEQLFDLKPKSIAERFGLHRPIFSKTASGGHFGREEFPWEQLDPEIMKALEENKDIYRDRDEDQQITSEEKRKKMVLEFSTYDNESLTDRFNEIAKAEFLVPSAIMALCTIHQELMRRRINCEMINTRDENGSIRSFQYTMPIKVDYSNDEPTVVQAEGFTKESTDQ